MVYYEDNPLLGEEKDLNAFKMSQRIADQPTRYRRVQGYVQLKHRVANNG